VSLAGRTISHYKIVDEISRGGMGVVYRATDTRLNRDVALKVLPPELTADPDRRERFIREARAASVLEHPNIAVIHDVGEEDGISFIAMELVRGDKLSHAIAGGPSAVSANPARALEIAIEVAEALARAHGQGIVHRDLKPANVMLTEDGHAKVIDFGLAKLINTLDGGGNTMTMGATDPQVILGTVSYMSPEQARGGTIDHRTDIFSFGIMLYEMFSNTLPFRGQSSIETMNAVINAPAAPLHLLSGAIPAAASSDIQRIIEKCLAKNPDDRYQGMKDLVVDLKAARRRIDSDASIAVSAPRPPVAAAAAAKKTPLLIAVASLALVTAAGYWFWTTQRAPIAQASGTRPSVAVMYFENNTGNQNLDWLRTGLTDMLVTDLSQSPDIEVLGTIQAYDTGFSTDCDEAMVLDTFCREGNLLNADLINISEEKQPNPWTSTCYRAKADFIRFKDREKARNLVSDAKYAPELIVERAAAASKRDKQIIAGAVFGGVLGAVIVTAATEPNHPHSTNTVSSTYVSPKNKP